MRRQNAYSLYLMTADGGGRPGGIFPSRAIAEALGDALKSAGACLDYDVSEE